MPNVNSTANPLVMNDNCQTPLDLARVKGHCDVVRAIEVCLHLKFSTGSEIFKFFFFVCCLYLLPMWPQLKTSFDHSVFRVESVCFVGGCGNFMGQAFWKHLRHSGCKEKCIRFFPFPFS